MCVHANTEQYDLHVYTFIWKYILCLIEIEIYISILLKFYQIAYKY